MKASSTRAVVIAGMSGGSGKSVVAVGLTAALSAKTTVIPFKKGPDYIDAGWLSRASGSPCYNLDPYLMDPDTVRLCFQRRLLPESIALVEGNRGLYDGVNAEGGYSTAELALQLDIPIILVVNCAKTTRTVAAMVLGCRQLDPRIRIAGVILNQIATSRHESIVRQAVETYGGVPVVGVMPRLSQDVFPMRHLGVVPHQEHGGVDRVVAQLGEVCSQHCDLDRIIELMAVRPSATVSLPPPPAAQVRIGVLRDMAFQFYYEDNLQALVDGGAELVEIDALQAPRLPATIDALYIGGGFPETSARALADNVGFRDSVRRMAQAGLPIYAECGGLIYLGSSICIDGVDYPLAGVFPVRFGIGRKPQAHGYSRFEVTGDNAFYPKGTVIAGHEFRYSTVLDWSGTATDLAVTLKRGTGFAQGRDGLVCNNVLALYTHVLAPGTPQWATGLLEAAQRFRQRNG